MSNQNFKLQYFPARGRGEHLRYILAHSGVKHEVEYIAPDRWASVLKTETPLGIIPCLVIDNETKITQSMVVGQFLSAELGLAGNDHLEASRVFMLAHGINDFHDLLVKKDVVMYLLNVYGTQDLNKAKEIFAGLSEQYQAFCGRYENWLKENGNGWLVGDKCSWADLFLAEVLDRICDVFDSTCLDKYPLIEALVKRVHDIPNIKKRCEEREQMYAMMPGNPHW